MYNRGEFLVDINPYAAYQFTPRFSAGIGWLERVSFSSKSAGSERVYGSRASFRLDWSKGFCFTFQPELLNTFVPPQLVAAPGTTEGQRQWVWSAFVGMKKSFAVYKQIRGTTEILYNLYNPESKSPYPDRLVVRFGFPQRRRR